MLPYKHTALKRVSRSFHSEEEETGYFLTVWLYFELYEDWYAQADGSIPTARFVLQIGYHEREAGHRAEDRTAEWRFTDVAQAKIILSRLLTLCKWAQGPEGIKDVFGAPEGGHFHWSQLAARLVGYDTYVFGFEM